MIAQPLNDEQSFEARVRLASSVLDHASAEVTVRLPWLGGVRVTTSLPSMAWLDARVRGEVGVAVLRCPGRSPLVVLRAGWYDREVCDVPVVWANRMPRG